MPGVLYRKSTGMVIAATSGDIAEVWASLPEELDKVSTSVDGVDFSIRQVWDGTLRNATQQEIDDEAAAERLDDRADKKRKILAQIDDNPVLEASLRFTAIVANEILDGTITTTQPASYYRQKFIDAVGQV